MTTGVTTGVAFTVDSGGVTVAAQLVRPDRPQTTGLPTGLPTLVLSHGLPSRPGGAREAGRGYPDLALRLCEATGWAVVTFNFRGTGPSGGNFSLGGWMADLQAVVAQLRSSGDTSGVWLAGSSLGGAMSVLVAATDDRIRGVVTLACPAAFGRWSTPRKLLDEARSLGMIIDPGFPPDFDAWTREVRTLRPLEAAARIPPRPFLIVHGTEDEVVPTDDARMLSAAAGSADLRILSGAGHRLRQDPRAVALLIGWMERQAAT